MTVFDQDYLMSRVEELDEEIGRQQVVFMEAQQQVFQLNGAKQALLQLLKELKAEPVPITEDELKDLVGAESVEFHQGELPGV